MMISNSYIRQAAQRLRDGHLVAFPTETVYGLGADATSERAVQKIFTAKGRPATNPLIVHVPDTTAARAIVTDFPPEAQKLAAVFWPGPLTIVLPKATCIANVATAGGSTVGVRVPNHPVALALLRETGLPVAAPSANRSERVSPTTAAHVTADLGDLVGTILDGGPCGVGIESTVLDLTTSPPTLLRPGHVRPEQIEAVIGTIGRADSTPDGPAKSPGQHTRHYAPNTPAFGFEPGTMPPQPAHVAALPLSAMPADPDRYAQTLYDTLRHLDMLAATELWIELPPAIPGWNAVRDRLDRATRRK